MTFPWKTFVPMLRLLEHTGRIPYDCLLEQPVSIPTTTTNFERGRAAYAGMAAGDSFARPLGNEEIAKTYETDMTEGRHE